MSQRLTLALMKNTIPLKELDERIKAVANDEQTSDAVRELLLLQGQIIQGLCAQVETLKAERDALKKKLYGKRSEKSSKPKKPKKPKDAQSKRKPRDPHRETLSRTALPEEIVEHAAPESCPKCGGHELKDLNAPEEQVIYELRPARLVKVKRGRQAASPAICMCKFRLNLMIFLSAMAMTCIARSPSALAKRPSVAKSMCPHSVAKRPLTSLKAPKLASNFVCAAKASKGFAPATLATCIATSQLRRPSN